MDGFSDKVGFIWSVADLLRGDFKPHEYGQVVLPFTVLRRLDCVLEPTKDTVVARARGLEGKVGNVDPILERVSGAPFYNVSDLSFASLLNDPANVAANLRTYLAGFSRGAADVLDKYGFSDKIGRLDRAGLLYQAVAKFADVDLHPDVVSNQAMGYIFEELLRRFSEMSNETAGEHFTPREVIRLMVNMLFAEDEAALAGPAPVRTMFDPAAGTGGMLTGGQDYLRELNPDARLQVYGQEVNAETWAVCRSDMLIKGEDPEHIVLGNSLTQDGHPERRFDYMLANPPFGVDWKKYAEPLQAEADHGSDGRFQAGLPRVSDGSFLFLQHMLSKMRPVIDDPATPEVVEGGSRVAIVFSGSPLFAGGAGSGESNIRRWIIENDWLEGIVALPDQMFYNTGISTYFWVLTNRKRPERRGRVALVDARAMATKMRKSLGNKRHYFTTEAIAEITRLYADAPHLAGTDPRVKVLANEELGYQRITVEQPMRRRWEVTEDALAELVTHKAWLLWATPPKNAADPVAYVHDAEHAQTALVDLLREQIGQRHVTEADFKRYLTKLVAAARIDVPDKVTKAVVAAAALPDPEAPVITDRRGAPLPDPELRDYENVPLGEDVEAYLAREVHPYASEAWIDHAKTRVGYEIPFTRHFYVYQPPRSVTELDAEIDAREARIRELLGGLAR